MRGDAPRKRRGEFDQFVLQEKQIDGVITRKVAALQQHRHAIFFHEDFAGFAPEEGSFDAGPAVVTIRYRGVIDSVTKRGVYRQSEGGEWYVITQF